MRLWTRQAEHAAALLRDGENRALLPGFALGPQVFPSADLGSVVAGAELLVVAVPSEAVRATLTAAAASLAPDATLVVVAKGIEPGTLMLMSEVTRDVLGAGAEARAVFLSGTELCAGGRAWAADQPGGRGVERRALPAGPAALRQ